jgi:hypothetical protein
MYNVISGELESLIEHEKAFGGFNDAPKGWNEIPEKDFAQSMFFSYTPSQIEYRQIQIDDKMISAQMFFFHDKTGVALSADYWKGKLTYFAFGCQHDYVEKEVGNCQHYRKCSKCDFSEILDSSD